MSNRLDSSSTPRALFIGLMSGTSLDGVDGVLSTFTSSDGEHKVKVMASAHLPFPPALRAELAELQRSGPDEIHREALAANQLARCYAACVTELLDASQRVASEVSAIGAHGQTVRHRPELGYTRQINNPALLAELTGIDVVADFRSRDVAAGGQGAPLVPAFHHWLFSAPTHQRVIANIGGISNISVLSPANARAVPTVGFDTGPGNVLMDWWIGRERGLPYDAGGSWGASGTVLPALLAALRSDDFFILPAPKSTGRDLFNGDWVLRHLAPFPPLAAADVQATLTELTATTLVDAVLTQTREAAAVHVCGGGAFNDFLLARIQDRLAAAGVATTVHATTELGVPPEQVEALAFGWLARQFTLRQAGNFASVTGAAGGRILGALYPA